MLLNNLTAVGNARTHLGGGNADWGKGVKERRGRKLRRFNKTRSLTLYLEVEESIDVKVKKRPESIAEELRSMGRKPWEGEHFQETSKRGGFQCGGASSVRVGAFQMGEGGGR